MDLFGVQELPASKSINAPGWAYVPDTGINPSVAALQPASNKRAARNQPNASAHENTAKQDAKILKGLEQLDKDSHKDVQIPVPVRHRDNAGRVSHGKVTPAVRKILQSQKTFANYLSDAEALAALAATQPQPLSATAPMNKSTPAIVPASTAKIPMIRGPYNTKAKAKAKAVASTPLRQVSMADGTPIGIKSEGNTVDTPMPDAVPSILSSLPTSQQLKPHPGDRDPLLISHIPPVPSEDEMQALITASPLTYLEARASLMENDLRRPARSFCEICGYWGRVRCMKCGAKSCSLGCLKTHQVDCYTRYGV